MKKISNVVTKWAKYWQSHRGVGEKLEHDRIFQSLRVLSDCFLLMESHGVLALTIAQFKRPERLVGPVN